MISKRQSNIELLRIICMLFIICGHIINSHDSATNILDGDEIIRYLFKSFTGVAANAFVLISGYFGITFKKERLLKLVFQTFFYSVVLLLISVAVGWHPFDIKKDFGAFLPILTIQYWFVTTYVVLYIISPCLNFSISSIPSKTFKKLLIVGFILIYVWPTFSCLTNSRQFIGDEGYGIVNFSYLYLLGRYLNLHYVQKHSPLYYFCGFLISGFTLFLCVFSISMIIGHGLFSLYAYNTIFIFIGSLCFFLTFKILHFESNIINYLAKPCLAVYLIHYNPNNWWYFCKSIGVSNYHGLPYIILLISLPIVIYLLCVVIERCRIILTNKVENIIIKLLKF